MKISKQNKDAVVVMSIRDYEELEVMEAEYLKPYFKSAEEDLAQDNIADGHRFLSEL